MPIGVIGMGSYVPDRIVTNAEIAAWTGTRAEWILARTGIHERRYAADGCLSSDLGVIAAERAVAALPRARDHLAAIVLATCTPDVPLPATGAILQHKLGISGTPAFDVNAVCSGFVYGMSIAEALLRSPHRHGDCALVVGADVMSSIMNRRDRRTVTLFGDGSAAVLLGEVPDGYGIVATRLLTDGSQHALVGVDGGGVRIPLDAAARERGDQYAHLDGRAVRDWVVSNLPKLIGQVLDDAGMHLDDIDRFVFHQANGRMLEDIVREMAVDPARVPFSVDRFGNIGCGSVALTLDLSHRRDPLRRGDRVLLAAAGAGLTAAATVLVWH